MRFQTQTFFCFFRVTRWLWCHIDPRWLICCRWFKVIWHGGVNETNRSSMQNQHVDHFAVFGFESLSWTQKSSGTKSSSVPSVKTHFNCCSLDYKLFLFQKLNLQQTASFELVISGKSEGSLLSCLLWFGCLSLQSTNSSPFILASYRFTSHGGVQTIWDNVYQQNNKKKWNWFTDVLMTSPPYTWHIQTSIMPDTMRKTWK